MTTGTTSRTADAQDGPVTVTDTLDWDRFAAENWDKRPIHVKGLAEPPFVVDEVFAAAVLSAQTMRRDARDGRDPRVAVPANMQFTIDRHQQPDRGEWLPDPADASLRAYEERVTKALDGRRYALIIHGFHGFHPPQWARERRFYEQLWQRVGQPISGAITTMFHGNYEHSPAGVHKDRFATFMFCLEGRKRMRYWAERPWTEPVTTMLDYQRFLDSSFAVEVEPGDLLYWPSSYYHVGESVGAGIATSVNIGVPRDEHRAVYDVDDLVVDVDPALLSDAALVADLLPPVTSPLVDRAGPGELPPALAEGLAIVRDRLSRDRIAYRAVELALRQRTCGGLKPVPPPAERRELGDDTPVRAVMPVATAPSGSTWLYAANGHVAEAAVTPETLATVVEALEAGRPVRAADAPAADRAGVRDLLENVERWHAAVR